MRCPKPAAIRVSRRSRRRRQPSMRRATMSRSPRRSRPRPAPSLRNCRRHWPRPSAISISPRCCAPVDGTFSNRLVSTGDYIVVGQRLGNVVPLDDVYIDANFKETQLKRIRPGQPVTISVDAYGHRKFAGYVDSISPAAGSVFTLLPPDNATGNFTKIVQRLPVRVRVPKDVARQNLLRAGHVGLHHRRYQRGRAGCRQRGRSRRPGHDPSAIDVRG